MINKNTTGIILAGGQSSRMGYVDKGLLPFNGKPIIQSVIEKLHPVMDEFIISANNSKYEQFKLPIIADIIEGKGPLGGIYTALASSNTLHNLVVACDMPFLNSALFERLLSEAEHYEVVIPQHNNNLEPLCAYYNKNCVSTISKLLNRNELKMHEVIKYFMHRIIPIEEGDPCYHPHLFSNINTPDTLENLQKELL